MKLSELAIMQTEDGRVIIDQGWPGCPHNPPSNFKICLEFDNFEDFKYFVHGLGQLLLLQVLTGLFGKKAAVPLTKMPEYIIKAFEGGKFDKGTDSDNRRAP